MLNRRLLIVSYHFPPSSEVAGKPTARLVRYLPRLGWEPVVMTIPADQVEVPLDSRGYADVVASTRVECVARWPYLTDGLRAVHSIGRRFAGWVARVVLGRRQSPPAGADLAVFRSARGRLVRLANSYAAFPDKRSGWVVPAVARALSLLRRGQFAAVVTVSPPHSAQLVGLALQFFGRRLPWVAHFHDPWLAEAGEPGTGAGRAPDRFQRWVVRTLESAVVRSADRVLLATDETRDKFTARYSSLPASLFGTLYNGYDPTDFTPSPEAVPPVPGPIRFVYAGALYWQRSPFPFLESVAQAIARGSVTADDIRVEFLGDCEAADGRSVAKVVLDLGLTEVVRIFPPVPYPEALARMHKADVLLLFAQGQPDQIPAKLYDYLSLGRFVLAYTDGASAKMVRDSGAGVVLGPADDASVVLDELFRTHREGRVMSPPVAPTQLSGYQAESLAKSLATQLDQLVADAP